MRRKPTVPELLTELGIRPPKPGKVIGQRIGGDPTDEREHFYICKKCGQAVDMRDLGQVFYHETPENDPLPTQ